MKNKYPLFKINFTGNEVKNFEKIINSGWISPGNYTKELESTFSKEFLDDQECITTSSCTTAIMMALKLSNVGKGDKVLISGLNFISVVNNILHLGAIPILVDSKSVEEPNLSFEDLKNKISPEIKALVVVHFAGYLVDQMQDIKQLCVDNDVALIEDAAHAPIATDKNGKKAGTYGEFSCFSFFSNKNIPAGEGGILSFNKKYNYKDVNSLKSHGMSILTQDRYKKSSLNYDVSMVGYNFRMPELSCALALEQVRNYLSSGLDKRREIIKLYREFLSDSSIRVIFEEDDDKFSAPHICCILLRRDIDRVHFQNELQNFGIQTSMHYPNLKGFSSLAKLLEDEVIVNVDEYTQRCITLPLYEELTVNDIKFICSKLLKLNG